MVQQAYLDLAIAAAIKAGEYLVGCQTQLSQLEITSKTSNVDLVSEADSNAQDMIQAQLEASFPDLGFIGEESVEAQLGKSGLAWVVDPLDGTSNFLSGLPIWAVSIGLCDDAMAPIVGVVHSPMLGKTWAALKGHGATLNAKPIQVRQEPPGGGLINSMLATGFPYDICSDTVGQAIEHFAAIQTVFHKVRRMGSAAIDMAYLAEGLFDGMWETKLKPWDTAAGLLLVQEAGGIVTRFDGSPYTPGDADMLGAATAELAAKLREVLKCG